MNEREIYEELYDILEYNAIVNEASSAKKWVIRKLRNARIGFYYLRGLRNHVKSQEVKDKSNPIDVLEGKFKTNNEYDWKKLANFKAHIIEYSSMPIMTSIILTVVGVVCGFWHDYIAFYIWFIFLLVLIISIAISFYTYSKRQRMLSLIESIEENHKND